MLTLCKTCCSTVRSYCVISNFCVTESRNRVLLYQNLTAIRTVRALGKACFCTVRRYCLICNLCVSKCRNNVLLYNDFTTEGAVLPRGKTCFCTSRIYCFINNSFVVIAPNCGNSVNVVPIFSVFVRLCFGVVATVRIEHILISNIDNDAVPIGFCSVIVHS